MQNDFETVYGVRYLPHLDFGGKTEQMRRKCPLLLKSPLFGKVQHDLARQFAKQLKEGFIAPASIRWIDGYIGYGLFAESYLGPGDFIGEYTGVVRRISRWKRNWNPYCLQYPTTFWSLGTYVVDAQDQGNEMRFINHSNRPNLRFACAVEEGLSHVVLLAIREIQPGEQLTVCYGKDY